MTVVPVSGGMTERQLTLIRDFEPVVIACTPSYALTLSQEFAARGVTPDELSLRLAVVGAEPWTESMRTAIDAGLGVRASNVVPRHRAAAVNWANTARPRPHRRPLHSAQPAASTPPPSDGEPCRGAETAHDALVGAGQPRAPPAPPATTSPATPSSATTSPAQRTAAGGRPVASAARRIREAPRSIAETVGVDRRGAAYGTPGRRHARVGAARHRSGRRAGVTGAPRRLAVRMHVAGRMSPSNSAEESDDRRRADSPRHRRPFSPSRPQRYGKQLVSHLGPKERRPNGHRKRDQARST